MKLKTLKELHSKSIDELKELVKTSMKELSILRMEKGAGKLKNCRAIDKKRQEIAVILTIIKEKEYAQ